MKYINEVGSHFSKCHTSCKVVIKNVGWKFYILAMRKLLVYHFINQFQKQLIILITTCISEHWDWERIKDVIKIKAITYAVGL